MKKMLDCEVCGRYMGLSGHHHRCAPPASAQTMQDYLEFASAFEDLQDKFEELVHAYLFHEEDTKDMEDIEKAHLLESIGLKIVFRDINPEEAKEWLNHRPFEDHES